MKREIKFQNKKIESKEKAKTEKLSKEELSELEQTKKNLKLLRKVMIGFDIFALFVLFFEIIITDVSYSSFIILILCNIITFGVNPKER